MPLKIVKTNDGSHSVYVEELDEHYHSSHGALPESKHVFINAGLKFQLQQEIEHVNILEIGYGTGLNALLTFAEFTGSGAKSLKYTGIEKYPLSQDIIENLNYPEILSSEINTGLFKEISKADWNRWIDIDVRSKLLKLNVDIHTIELAPEEYNLVYFDAFGYDAQEDMWTSEVFQNISQSMKAGGVLTTYCTKGVVRRTMEANGFELFKLPGAAGKREMLRAIKI